MVTPKILNQVSKTQKKLTNLQTSPGILGIGIFNES